MTDFLNALNFDKKKINELSPLVLAYIGDAVFELFIRNHLITGGNRQIKDIHKDSCALVCAKAQSEAVHKLMDMLSEDELLVFKRGRNTNSSVPKNADMTQYRNATGFEALLGYLYLKGKDERLLEILLKTLE